MDAALYVRSIRANWLLIAVLAMCGGVGLGVLADREAPVYRTEVRLLVSFVPATTGSPTTTDGPASASPSAQTNRLMQRRVKSYTAMLPTSRVTDPVIDALGLPLTPEQLGAEITASSPFDTHVIDVTVTDASASRAVTIANALAAELGKIAAQEEPSTDIPANTAVSIERAASVPDRPAPVRWQLRTIAGTAAGFAIGLGIALLRGRRMRAAVQPA
ncbi:YveK family protein [Phytohabitans rumicis]|uniref:Polysaccharide chain length determinant N-terminal domain-containing protein n=1 Tax=Phytohabitans rumicis TaxID=1076125 RepID=A0A6V8LCF1_9ACTN|nr:lipopolysaccharide biosynthesis protein [Phytohabitans rumicis]GFJ92269.1 hypothetical protein Prum_059110 [Phytohabitans rumicis]